MSRSYPSPNDPFEKGSRSRTHRRVLNLPLLIATVAIIVVVAPATYAWHAYQINRTAGAFLVRADTLEKDGKLRTAADYVHRYLQLRPDDLAARLRLAETFDKAAETPRQKVRAVKLYYQVLGKIAASEGDEISEERQVEMRRRLAGLLLNLGALSREHATSAALEAWELYQESDGKDAEAARILPLAVYRIYRSGTSEFDLWDFVPLKDTSKKPASLGILFKEAINLNPDDVELCTTLAHIYRNEPNLLDAEHSALGANARARQADTILDKLVEANPDNPDARVARCAYRTQYQVAGSEEDLRAALRLGAQQPDVLLFAAARARRDASTLDTAAGYFKRVIKLAETDPRAYLGLGDVYLQQSKPDEAIAIWREGLEKCGETGVELNLRLADTLINHGKLEEGEKTLAKLARVFQQIGPSLPLPTRRAVQNAEDLLRGKLMISRRRYLEAIPLLRSVARSQGNSPAALQAWLLLGDSYAAATQWDQAATAYSRAGSIQPKLDRAHLAAATAWLAAGDPSLAIPYFKKALEVKDSPETRISLAQATLQHLLTQPADKRNWKGLAKELEHLKKLAADDALSEPWRLNLIEAEYILVRADEDGQREMGAMDALGLIRQAERDHADSKAFCRAAVMAYEKLGQPEDADRMLEKYSELIENPVAVALVRSRLYAQRGDHEKARSVLREAQKSAPQEAQTLLQLSVADAERAGGDMAKSREELLALYEDNPNSIWLVHELADRALVAGDLEGLQQWEDKLRELEGTRGTTWRYFRSQRLLLTAKKTDDSEFEEAAELAHQVVSERPTWSRAHTLAGMIEDRRGNRDKAIESYKMAIRLGERRLVAYERLARLLFEAGRAKEAETYLSKLDKYIEESDTLTGIGMTLSTQLGKPEKAIELAKNRLAKRPTDPEAHITLANAYVAVNKPEEAEKSYLKACELAPENPRTWNMLFSLYARTNQRDKARDTLQNFADSADVEAGQKAYILAQGYEVLGHLGQANDNYTEAVRLAPDSPAIWLRYARFLERIDPAEAEKAYRRSIQLSPRSVVPRVNLGRLLIAQGGLTSLQEALVVVDPAAYDDNEQRWGCRLRAWLLNKIGGPENLREARRLYEKLVANPKSREESDRLTLAKLYEDQGMPQKAREQYLALVARSEAPSSYIAMYADFLLRNDFIDEASKWLSKLEDAQPDTLSAAVILAKYMHGIGQSGRVKPVVDQYISRALQRASNDELKARIYLAAGALYSDVEQYAEAERWYRQAMPLVPRDTYPALAMCLLKQERVRDAIRVCLDAAASDKTTKPAILLATMLTNGKASAEDFALAEPLFAAVTQVFPEDANLLFNIAGVRVVQGRNTDAIELYESVLKSNPRHALVLNNLATLLAEIPDRRQQALQYIDRAIAEAGQQSALLDTKGMILVEAGNIDEAVACLKQAAAVRSPDPRYLFHLALAYYRGGDMDNARREFLRIDPADLSRQILTGSDRQMLAELQKRFSP